MFNEGRRDEISDQRKNLSLSALFSNPRPMWATPVLLGIFADAYISKVTFEGNGTLAWSFVVLNHRMQQMTKQSLLVNAACGLDTKGVQNLSYVLEVMQRSVNAFKLLVNLLRNPSEQSLLRCLPKMKKMIVDLEKGQSILLPLLVEAKELLVLVECTTERLYTFIVIQTDPQGGLENHAVSASARPAHILYRTCLVLSGIPKRDALDDVFWAATYNLAINSHKGDMNRFYDVLLPFLTGKPLEESLVASELASGKDGMGNTPECGGWRAPQIENTGYVQCVFEAVNYILRKRGSSEFQSHLVCLYILMFSCILIDIITVPSRSLYSNTQHD
jgi:hypothetical protein